MSQIRFVGQLGPHRLRARRLDEIAFAGRAQRKALESGEWVIDVAHGGVVTTNSYGYPAWTECALVVSAPNGLTICWVARARANKASWRSVAEACYPGSGDLWDNRIKNATRLAACREMLTAAHAAQFPPLVQLAAASTEIRSS